jgi:formate hydrogenlyase transcriptional activator
LASARELPRTVAHSVAALDAAGRKIYGPEGAAALLGLKPTTLQSKLQKYGVIQSRSP